MWKPVLLVQSSQATVYTKIAQMVGPGVGVNAVLLMLAFVDASFDQPSKLTYSGIIMEMDGIRRGP